MSVARELLSVLVVAGGVVLAVAVARTREYLRQTGDPRPGDLLDHMNRDRLPR